jgi:two-component system nitrogen regulation response regulator GlnG/two-component system response regulator HydG
LLTESPSTLDVKSSIIAGGEPFDRSVPALMIAWSESEPHRVGEVVLFEMEGTAQVLGRGEPPGGSSSGRAVLVRQRPGETSRTPALQSPSISREQLRIRAQGRRLRVELLGKCPMLFRGERVDACVLAPGDTLLLKGQLLLLCTERPRLFAPTRDLPPIEHGFGAPDPFGFIGESPAMWRLRDTIAFQAKSGAHALVLGPSGAGKELVARALHRMSARVEGPFIARNAATLPAGILEAELFGNAKNYPNPGMAERPGLIGAADGGTLFLDEIGELAPSLHASLLRVLDGDGEYHRLGESKSRRANLRLLAATNRPPDALKHDLLARLPLRVQVPGIDQRREDIPLLVRHLLVRALEKSPELVGRFAGADRMARVSPELVEHLLHRPYTTHVRELEGLLWRAMAASRGAVVELPADMAEEIRVDAGAEKRTSVAPAAAAKPRDVELPEEAEPSSTVDPKDPEAPRALPEELGAEELRARIAEHNGNLVKAARAMGLPSRYALYRLLRKHGIDVGELRDKDVP